jgi:hypothetical protein
MGSTADNWEVAGTLTVTGASTLTGNVAVTGTSTLTGNTSVTGTTTCTGLLTTGNIEANTGASDYLTTYSWMNLDGVNPITFDTIRLYDHKTVAFRQVYLYDGSLVAV